MPRFYIISGPNGSGKTTASYGVLPELLDCVEFVNSDEFAKHLAPFAPESAYITASRLMLKKVQYLFDRREDFCIETTLATRALIKMVRSAQAQGYYCTVLYFWLNSPDIAIERVAKRVATGGHDIPEETIRRRYIMGLNYLFHSYMPHDPIRYNRVRSLLTDYIEPQKPIENITESIVKEMGRAPLAHDGVPFEGALPLTKENDK